MASIQHLIKNLFKTNSQKLASFRALETEFDGLNRGLQAIQAERERLAALCESRRQEMLASFSVESVKAFSVAATANDDFSAAANAAGTLHVHTISQRQQTPRVRETCHSALGAAAQIVQSKLDELIRADAKHFEQLGLDPSACGESAPIGHLRGVLGQIAESQKSTVGENLFEWANIRGLLKSMADS